MTIRLAPILAFVTLFSIIQQGQSKNVLIFHHTAGYSHLVVTRPIAEGLSAQGHNVTYIAPFYSKQHNPNITEIVPVQLSNWVDKVINQEFDINMRITKSVGKMIDVLFVVGYDGCEAVFTSPEFKDWLKQNPKMDLVIVDHVLPECGIALAHRLGAKYAVFSTLPVIPYEFDAFGYVPESSAIPEMESDTYTPMAPMGFLTRVSNALTSLMFRARHYMFSIRLDKFIRDALQAPDMPFIADLVSNVSLVFYTGDVFSDYPRALPPNFVNVAGTHCKESTKDLPEDINDFLMNGTSDGFVYFSLGSFVVSSTLPERTKQVFVDTLRSFPNVKFLWKWNGDIPDNIPENVYISQWFPQADILGHPKIKAFITQCGRPSTLEAIFNGVPIVAFPIIGDQDYNANRLHQMEVATKLEIGTVTVEEFQDAIKKAVYDPRTKERMARIQKLFRDRPMTPVDTAVWWSEYVMRNDDVSHLRPAGHNQNWFVRRQIDVWAFLSISIFVLTVSFLVLVTKIVRICLKQNIKLKQI